MEVLVFLVPLALGLGLVGLLGFLWSLKSGQYDDLEGAAWRAIADDDNFSIKHKLLWRKLGECLHKLRKITPQRLAAFRLQQNFAALAKHKTAKAIPLGFIEPAWP